MVGGVNPVSGVYWGSVEFTDVDPLSWKNPVRPDDIWENPDGPDKPDEFVDKSGCPRAFPFEGPIGWI